MTTESHSGAAQPTSRRRKRIRLLAVTVAAVTLTAGSVTAALQGQAAVPPTPAGWTPTFRPAAR